MPPLLVLFLICGNLQASPIPDNSEKDGDASRKILGSSVVTSVSVIMDSGNGSQTYFADAAGKPVSKPQTGAQLASPINLLNPDRYEFFTFDDNGELIKRLMTLEEIQGIIANGDGEETINSDTYLPEKKVNDIVSTVQNVLKEEIKSHKNNTQVRPMLDTPDVSSTWSMILPAIFGNSGEDITPDKTQTIATPETIMVENAEQVKPAVDNFDTTKFEMHGEEIKPIYINIPEAEIKKPDESDVPIITVEVIKNKPSIQNVQYPSVDVEATENVERIPFNKTKVTKTPNLEATTITNKKQDTTTEKSVKITTASTTTEIKIQKPTTPTPLNISKFEEIVKTERTTSYSLAAESTSQLLWPVSTMRPAPFTTNQAKPESPEPTKQPTLSNLQSPSTGRPILFIGNQEVDAPVKIQTESSTKAEPIISLAIEENVTDVPLDEIKLDTNSKSPLNASNETPNTSDKTQTATINSVLLGSTTTPTSTSISPSVEITTTTTPILLIIQEKLKDTTTPETSTPTFLSTFFFIDDRNKNKHQTTSLPEEAPTSPSSNQVTIAGDFHKNEDQEESHPTKVPVSNNFKPTWGSTLEDQVTTLRVNIEQTTQNQLKETPQLPVIFSMQDSSEEEETKQAPIRIQILTEKNEQITEKATVNDQSTVFSTIQDATNTPLLYDLGLEPNNANDATTTWKDNIELTTQNPTTTSKQVVTENLEQFLLTSTNIYEINSQLADLANDSLTTVTPLEFTTEQSLVSSIEQLISQAVGNDETPVTDVDDSRRVEEVLDNTKDKPMEKVQAEVATVASFLLDKTTDSIRDETLQLSEAVGSLLSQVSDAFPIVNGTMESLLQMDLTEVPVTKIPADSSSSNTAIEEMVIHSSSTENIFDELITKDTNSINKFNAQTQAPEVIYEEIDIQKIIDEIKLTKDSNKTVTKKTVDKTNVQINAIEAKQNKTSENKDVQNVYNERNETKRLENKTDNPINEATTEEKDKIDLTEMEINLTKENFDINKTKGNNTEVLETNPSEIKVSEQKYSENYIKLQTATEKVINVNDVITSTAKYSTSSFLTPSANNVIKTVTKNRINAPIPGGNYKMETATEILGTLTTKSKLNQEQIKPNISLVDEKNSTWTLVPTVLPHSNTTFAPVALKPMIDNLQPSIPVKLSAHPVQGFGLEDSTSRLDTDIYQFVELCNELAFGFWSAVTTGISSVRSVFVSPFAATSLLAMVFLGARGATSGEMNEILKLDDMVTFNPHLIFKNVSESIEVSKNAGVAASVIARELYSDKNKGKLLNFYKERAKQFYDGHVEEVNFKEIGDIIRRRTNLLIKKYTWGKIQEYMKDGSVTVRPPLAGVSASVFQTDCTGASTQGRDGELYFVVLPSVRQRRLIPIPSAVWRGGFLAGYDPALDATAAAIGTQDQIVSVIFVIPGQQGVSAPGDGLSRLEKRLVESSFKQGSWSRLLRSLIPRPGLELQIPRFSHKSVINATVALKNMGLKDLFSYDKADLKGLNGASHELHLSDILQINNFVTCGEVPIGDNHHVEIYPATGKRPSRRSRKLEFRLFNDPDLGEEPRDYQRAFNDPLHDPDLLSLPLSMRPRQARIPDTPRLRFDRPFLFFVRHNPTGLILHMGRFNPRLLP